MRQGKDELNEVTARFFHAFTNRGGVHPEVDCLYELFTPEAQIIKMTGGTAVRYGVEDFIEPRRAILTDGTLTDFCEEEVSETTEIFGNIAQRFSRYTKSWFHDGRHFSGGGVKSIQFIRVSGQWRICSLTWDDED